MKKIEIYQVSAKPIRNVIFNWKKKLFKSKSKGRS